MKLCYVLIILSLIFSNAIYAQSAGKVVFSSGINKIVDRYGKSRIAKRGASVNSGDRLQTSSGHMQVRFTDDGFVALKPRTEMLVEEYRFDGKENGKENAIFNLLKGSVRAVTGLVGKNNKNAYKYKTPVATIGIRGTAFVLNYCNKDCKDSNGNLIPDGLYVNNGEGKVIVTSNGGVLDLVRGQFAYVANENSRPQQTLQAPSISSLIREAAEQYDFGFDSVEADESLNPIAQTSVSGRTALSRAYVASDPLVLIGVEEADYELDDLVRSNTYTGSSFVLRDGDRIRGFYDDYLIEVPTGTDVRLQNQFYANDDATGEFGCANGASVCWGTWESGWSHSRTVTNTATGEVVAASSFNPSSPLLFSYIYSDDLTPLANTFTSGTSPYLGVSGTATFGSRTDLVENGQVAFISASATSGTEAIYGEQSVYMEIDFDNLFINDLEIKGTFDGRGDYELGLASGPQSIVNGIITGNGGTRTELQGTCDAGLCGAGNTNLIVAGVNRPDFTGATASGAIGTYAAGFGDATTEAYIVGNYFIANNGLSEPVTTASTARAFFTSGGIGDPAGPISNFLPVDGSITDFADLTFDAGGNNIEAFSSSDNNLSSNIEFNARVRNDGTTPSTGIVIQGAGSDATLDVHWGYWTGTGAEYQFTADGSQVWGNDPIGSSASGATHFIQSSDITPDAVISALGTTVVYDQFLSGLSGVSNNITYAEEQSASYIETIGLIDFASMTVDFGAAQVTDFQLDANINGTSGFVVNGLDSSSADIADRSFDFDATNITCSSCLFSSIGTTGAGTVNFDFVGSTDAEAVIGTISVGSDSNDGVINGTFGLRPGT